MAGAHTLPKDFTFFSPTESEPRTPDRPLRDLSHPPRPQHASHRVRRRRMERKPIPFCAPDVPLPSIELSRISPADSAGELPQSVSAASSSSMFDGCGFLDVPRRQRDEPKTPPAQIRDLVSQSFENGAVDGTTTPVGASISRPSSACSHASDSSFSSTSAASFDSFDSFASLGGSCTSPETEIDDPFLAVTLPDNKDNLDTPTKSVKNTPVIPANLSQNQRWSSEMDHHLWNTYQTHLQDPTITPFKMLPGSLPPLGVSHRVAREARRAWMRAKQPQSQPQSQSQSQPQSSYPQSSSHSHSQPSEGTDSAGKSTPQWPRSDAATRRRLKELCKRKYSIAPHYQRLLQSRSPSPPPDMLSNYTTLATPAPFTRDLGISLVSGTLPSDPPEALTPNIVSNAVNSMTTASDDDDVPRLGSPFMYHTWGPSNSRPRVSQADTTPVQPAVEAHDTVHVTGSRLRAGIAPDLFTPNNRQHLPEVPVPADAKDQTPQRVRIRTRTRGVTMNSSSSNTNNNMLNINSRHRLVQLFTPPSGSGSNETDDLPSHSQTNSLEVEGERIKRLGSPFNLDLPASKRPQPQPRRYYRPRHAPSRSDTFLMHPPVHAQGQPLFSNFSSAADIDTSDMERAPAPVTALHSPEA